MGKEVKNVIVIKNMYNEMFEEVIFVLKKGMPADTSKDKNIVWEAKKIVEDYVNRTSSLHVKNKSTNKAIYEVNEYAKGSKLNIILNICLLLSILLFVTMLGKLM